jgi:hypothetical protein
MTDRQTGLPQQKKQRCKDNIQSRSRAEPHLFGVDIKRGLAEPNRRKHHHRTTEHDQQQFNDVADDPAPLRQRSCVSDALAILKNRSNFWTRKPNAMMAIAVRTQARNVRSFAALSLYRSIIARGS